MVSKNQQTATTSTSDMKVSDDRRKAKRRSGRSRRSLCFKVARLSPTNFDPRDPLALKRSRRRQTWTTSTNQPKSPLPGNGLATWVFARVAQANEIAWCSIIQSRPHLHAQISCRFPQLFRFVRGLPTHASSRARSRPITIPAGTAAKSWLFFTSLAPLACFSCGLASMQVPV